MIGRRSLAPALLLVVAAGAAWSQPATVPAPVLKEGDRWSYVLRDGFTGIEQSSSSERVTATRAEGYTVEWTRPEGVALSELTLDTNAHQSIDGVAGDTQELSFPLAVGKKWKSLTLVRNPANSTTSVLDLEREVVGNERVKTAAGEFDTLKIVARGRWILKSDPLKVAVTDFSGRMEMTLWYAPAVKNYVAFDRRTYAKGHVGAWTRFELTAFELH